jgi:hypothetical protein
VQNRGRLRHLWSGADICLAADLHRVARTQRANRFKPGEVGARAPERQSIQPSIYTIVSLCKEQCTPVWPPGQQQQGGETSKPQTLTTVPPSLLHMSTILVYKQVQGGTQSGETNRQKPNVSCCMLSVLAVLYCVKVHIQERLPWT